MPITSPVFASLGRSASNLLAAPREFPPPSPEFQELMRRPAELAGHSSLLSWLLVAVVAVVPVTHLLFRGLRKVKLAPPVKEGGALAKVDRGIGKFRYYLGPRLDAAAIVLAPLILYLRYEGIGPVKLHCYEAEAIIAGAAALYDAIDQIRVRRPINRQKDLTKKEKKAAKIQALGIFGK